MSHNYPYKRSPDDFSSHQGAFSTPDNIHHEERHPYQTSLQPSPRSTSVFTSQKSALESYSSRSSTTTNSALSLLSSCGLEPEDLSVLAGMPENMITEESLPRVLMEIRQKKGLSDRSCLSSTHRSTSHQPLQPPSDSWENSARSAPAKYLANPPQHSSYPPIPPPRSSYPLPREEPESWKDRWGNPRQSGRVRQGKTSSTYVVDYNYGQPQEGDSRNVERPAYSAREVDIDERPHLQSSSNYQQLNPGKEPAAAYQKKLIPPLANTVHSTPTAREANDFHGSMPQTFPYACSLCDIAVLSQKDWTLHMNEAQHANSQLAMLQMYPKWNCRTGSARQIDYNSEKGSEGKYTGGRGNAAPQNHVPGRGLPVREGGPSALGCSAVQEGGLPPPGGGLAVREGERHHLQSSSHYQQLNPGKEPAAAYQKELIPPLATTVHSTPTAREANDFHGSMPQTFPHTCSLCDIAVLSQKDWTLHINGAQHANSQLVVLQTIKSSSNYGQLNPGKEPAAAYQKKLIPPLATTVHSTPTAREANDFHGSMPQNFPYACSLCDIAVLSQKDWTLHINGAQHANSQLAMLQMYPEWDCRTGSARQSDYNSEKGSEGKNTGERKHGVASSCEGKSYPIGDKASGRVVCAKYVANSMDEHSIRRLVGQVGSAVNVMMFPVQAFIEMSSPDEAQDVVKYFNRNPVVIEGSLVQFSLSATYNFLQNSPVVIFSLLPPGHENYPEIMDIAKRFGPVKHSLFLPNRVLLEMGSREVAGKLVQYYTSHPLKMKGNIIQVSHSTKHSTLKFAVTDKETEGGEASRHIGLSYNSQTRSSPSLRRRSPSPRRSPGPRRSPSPRRRSPIQRKRSPGDRRRSLGSRKKSLENRDVDKVEDKASQVRTQSSSRHRSHTKEDENISRVHSVEKTANTQNAVVKVIKVKTEPPDLGSNQEPSCTNTLIKESVPSPTEHPQDHGISLKTADQIKFEEGKDSDMDSDIEGMAVIGADEEIWSEEGSMEFLEDMEEHVCDEAGTSADNLSTCPLEVAEAGENKKQGAGGEELAVHPDKEPGSQSLSADPAVSEPPGVMEAQEQKQEGQEDMEEPHETYDEDEPDFPESLEHCITLDELEDEDGEGQAHLSEGNSEDESGWRTNRRERRRMGDGEDGSSRTKSRKEEEPPSKKVCIREEKTTPAELSSSIKAEEKAASEEPSSNKEQQQEEDEKAVTEESSSNKEQQQEEKAVTEEPSSNKEQQQEEEEKAATEEPSSHKEQYQEEDEKAVTEESSSNKEQQQEEKAVTEEPSSNKEQQQEEEEKAATEEPSSHKEQQQEEEEKAVTEEPSSDKEQQQEEEEKAASEEPRSNKEQQQEEEEKAATEEPRSNKEEQQEEEEKGTSETPCEQEELMGKTENENIMNSQPSDSMDTMKDTEEETSIENPDGIKPVCVKEEKVEMMTETTHVPLGPYLPNNPMGREFVSQKIGYFCSLCNAIYVTEDEARNEHCSSHSHYEKLKAYMEQKGNPAGQL